MDKATKKKFIEGWDDFYSQLEKVLNDESIAFGKKASICLDMIDLALPALNKLELLHNLHIDILANTTANKKVHLEYKLITPEYPDSGEKYVRKTENEMSEL